MLNNRDPKKPSHISTAFLTLPLPSLSWFNYESFMISWEIFFPFHLSLRGWLERAMVMPKSKNKKKGRKEKEHRAIKHRWRPLQCQNPPKKKKKKGKKTTVELWNSTCAPRLHTTVKTWSSETGSPLCIEKKCSSLYLVCIEVLLYRHPS